MSAHVPAPESQITASDVYAAVAARRAQWDNLVWQVPLLSLTAQAFLLTLALGPDTSQVGRIGAAVVSAGITVLCVTLMKRHRQAEIADAEWLASRENELGKKMIVHGKDFRKRRDATSVRAGRIGKAVPTWPGYKSWTIGLTAFLAIDALVIGLAFGGQNALATSTTPAVSPTSTVMPSP